MSMHTPNYKQYTAHFLQSCLTRNPEAPSVFVACTQPWCFTNRFVCQDLVLCFVPLAKTAILSMTVPWRWVFLLVEESLTPSAGSCCNISLEACPHLQDGPSYLLLCRSRRSCQWRSCAGVISSHAHCLKCQLPAMC